MVLHLDRNGRESDSSRHDCSFGSQHVCTQVDTLASNVQFVGSPAALWANRNDRVTFSNLTATWLCHRDPVEHVVSLDRGFNPWKPQTSTLACSLDRHAT